MHGKSSVWVGTVAWAAGVALSLGLGVAAPAGGDGLVVGSWNLHHGAGADGRIDLERGAHPVVLAGDFNDVADSPVMRLFAGDGWSLAPAGGPTSPAARPRVAIDHVVLRGLAADGAARVIDEPVASDHRPVVLRVVAGRPGAGPGEERP